MQQLSWEHVRDDKKSWVSPHTCWMRNYSWTRRHGASAAADIWEPLDTETHLLCGQGEPLYLGFCGPSCPPDNFFFFNDLEFCLFIYSLSPLLTYLFIGGSLWDLTEYLTLRYFISPSHFLSSPLVFPGENSLSTQQKQTKTIFPKKDHETSIVLYVNHTSLKKILLWEPFALGDSNWRHLLIIVCYPPQITPSLAPRVLSWEYK